MAPGGGSREQVRLQCPLEGTPTSPVTIVLEADGSMWLLRRLRNFVVQLQSGSVELVECQSLQMLTTWNGSSGYTAEVAEIGWINTMNTLPDHQGRLEHYSLANR